MMTPRAVWKGQVLAESEQTVEVEGNQYFPVDSLKREFLAPGDKRSTCPWKGTASYYDVTVEGATNANAGWYYPNPAEAASQIRDHVAFWHGVRVEPVTDTHPDRSAHPDDRSMFQRMCAKVFPTSH